MWWTRLALLTCLTVLIVLTLFHEVNSASVSDGKVDKNAASPPAEQRQRLAADERKREYHEEQRNEFESYAEEEHDEQDERTREKTEQWREFHYDGLDPSYEYNRHTI